jgi:hypothetical protein
MTTHLREALLETLRDDFVGAHHLVVFVFQHVAVPDVTEFPAGSDWGSGGEIEQKVAGNRLREGDAKDELQVKIEPPRPEGRRFLI